MLTERDDQVDFASSQETQERLNGPSLFLVGISFNAKDFLADQIEEEIPLLVIPFVYDLRDESEFPLLKTLPLQKPELESLVELGKDALDKVPYLPLVALEDANKLEPLIAEQFNVTTEELKFASSSEDIPLYLRHEMGYHLLRLAEENGSIDTPERLRDAMSNTGNMFLLSVGVNQWIPRATRRAFKNAYNESFASTLGKLPLFGRPAAYKTGMIEFIDRQIGFLMEAKENVQMATSSYDLAELGEGGLYAFTKLAQKGVYVEIVTDTKRLTYPVNSVVLSIS